MCNSCNFSFAGIKTAVLNTVESSEALHNGHPDFVQAKSDLCASFQRAVFSHIAHRTHRCAQMTAIVPVRTVYVASEPFITAVTL